MNTPSARPPTLDRLWRVATAVRVFVLALATGLTLSADDLPSMGVLLLSLGMLAAAASAIEVDAHQRIVACIPLGEGVLAAALIGTTNAHATPLVVYLVVPPVVAGLRHGWVNVANTTLAMVLTLVAAYTAAGTLGVAAPQIAASVPWLSLGCGTGMLATWLTRSVRALETAQAPYAAAHRLLTQLRAVSQRIPSGLDTPSVAQQLVDDVHAVSGAERTALLVRSGHQGLVLVLVAEAGAPPASEDDQDQIARECLETRRIVQHPAGAALPVRVGDYAFGALVHEAASRPAEADLQALQATVDEQSLRLDTALLFDDVRALATAEERSRLAREIHDGVAQGVASLGYLVDDLAATTADPATLDAAAELRREISRIVHELRLSMFDLRHGVGETADLAAALADYVREVSARSDLRVHLVLDEHHTQVSRRVETELLRIGQEAVSNARKHAQATNLWVQLTTDGRHVQLRIEDDGLGSPMPRPHHYGLQTMQERARHIDADLQVTSRPLGGTIVTVRTRVTAPLRQGDDDADQRVARR